MQMLPAYAPTVRPMATALQLRWAAEWAPHKALWIAYPHDVELWGHDLEDAQQECLALCKALSLGDRVRLVVASEAERHALRARTQGLSIDVHVMSYGDIWLRDTAPVFLRDATGVAVAGCFRFNGWGNKYDFADDHHLNLRMANSCAGQDGTAIRLFDLVLEGGSVETDGEGTVLTSRQCLLNPNRNPGLDQAAIEKALAATLGAEKVLWVDAGLRNDHTDGHIDTLARFVAPGQVVCMAPSGGSDPNVRQLDAIHQALCTFTDARGRRLRVHQIPSPGAVYHRGQDLLPASYLNFLIGNDTVAVPTYQSPYDQQAVAALAKLFPRRRTLGLRALAILSGGGAFHCMSQQMPA